MSEKVINAKKSLTDMYLSMDDSDNDDPRLQYPSIGGALVWTVIDQQRLTSLTSLHHRMLEYHNNVHVKADSHIATSLSSIPDIDESYGLSDELNTIMVAQVIKFLPNSLEPSFPVTAPQLTELCAEIAQFYHIKQSSSHDNLHRTQSSSGKEHLSSHSRDFIWIHLRDLSGLEICAQHFGIHELIITGFQDLRAHSGLVPAKNELLCTMITSNMEDNKFYMYKLFIYVSQHVVITFQAEVLPDFQEESQSPTQDSIIQPLMQNHQKLRKKCLKYGTGYLLYELVRASLHMFNSCLEFISYSLSYFNRVVHLELLHRERLRILVKMHNISSGIRLFKHGLSESNGICETFVNAAMAAVARRSTSSTSVEPVSLSASFGGGIQRLLWHIILEEHAPYFIDLLDDFEYVQSCLELVLEESVRLESKLEATMHLRSSNTAVMLSLIGTLFLPMTFFAGVFGMNFQVGGDYTMTWLNDKDGPFAFYAMCISKYCSIVLYAKSNKKLL